MKKQEAQKTNPIRASAEPEDPSGPAIHDTATTSEPAAPPASAGEPAPSSPARQSDQIEGLEAKVAEQEAELEELRDKHLRDRAELDNFKKRMTREKSEALRFATEPLIRNLLPAIDNLQRALAAAADKAEADPQALRDGVAMVQKQFEEILSKAGVVRIPAADRPFDPNEHEAVAHLETTRAEPGKVLDEHLPGYKLHDRLLRAAQVTVAKGPGTNGN